MSQIDQPVPRQRKLSVDEYGMPIPYAGEYVVDWPAPLPSLGYPDAELQSILDTLFAAAAGNAQLWGEGLGRLRDAFEGTAAQICITTPSKQRFDINLIAATNLPLMNVDAYEVESFDDPFLQQPQFFQKRVVSSSVHFKSEDVHQRALWLSIPPPYRQFMLLYYQGERTTHLLCLLRAEDGPKFTLEDCARFQTLMPDFERICDILHARIALQDKPKDIIQALDAVSGPYALANGAGDILHVNARAQALLGADPEPWSQNNLWVAACQAATRDGRAHHQLQGATLELTRISNPNDEDVGVFRSYFSDYLLVDFTMLRSDASRHLDQISATYGLTPSETEVLSLLGQGVSTRDIARQRETTIETVRVQMRALREKTGLTRKAQLAALLVQADR
jgi:DNA-binding CsgD family transcriptional regulator